jgi:hypothetical protein
MLLALIIKTFEYEFWAWFRQSIPLLASINLGHSCPLSNGGLGLDL